MYRTYTITEAEAGKITRARWDGDTYYYDVFESVQELEAEEARLQKIDAEYREAIQNIKLAF